VSLALFGGRQSSRLVTLELCLELDTGGLPPLWSPPSAQHPREVTGLWQAQSKPFIDAGRVGLFVDEDLFVKA